MATPDYVLIGNITADIAPDSRQLGGTVSYSAPTAAAFGLKVGVLTAAAEGEPLLGNLPSQIHLVHKPASVTTTFENIYTPQGRVQYIRAVSSSLTTDDIPSDWRESRLVHLGPLTGEVDPSLAALFPHARVLLTLQGCLRQWGDDGRVHFLRWLDRDALRHVDIVVFSEEDIAEAPEMEAEYASAVRHLIVTRAERGGSLYIDGVRQEYATPQVTLVHPTGAGDIFAAALLAALDCVEGDYAKACSIAAILAAISVTRTGLASVPNEVEVRAAIAAVTAPH
jgi:sugar/nucleoside kinase (ribokinase family)